MSAFAAIVRVTIRQLVGRKRAVGFGLLSLIPAGLLLAASRARELDGIDTDFGVLVVIPFFSIVLPLTTLILAGSALSDERRDKTLSFLVLRPIGRLQIVVAKTLAAFAASAMFVVVCATLLCLTYVVVGGEIGVLPSIVVGGTLACVLYSSVFVLLGYVTTRPTLVGILYVIFIESSLVDELPRISSISPWRVGLAATIDMMPQEFPSRVILGAIGNLAPSMPSALGATAVAAVVAVGICTILLSRTDSV
jgi:ABC-2 type transport system permease protein